jgi:hypothetical protein
MKRLALLLLVLSLNGCALIDAYFMAGYDNNEYAIVNKIRTTAELSVDNCKDQTQAKLTFENLYILSYEFKNFTQYIPRNQEAHKLSEQVLELSKQGKELYAKGNVSEVFCKLKLQQVSRSAETIQQVLGSKPR